MNRSRAFGSIMIVSSHDYSTKITYIAIIIIIVATVSKVINDEIDE